MTPLIKNTNPLSMGTQTGQQDGLVPPPGAGGDVKPRFATKRNKATKKTFEYDLMM